MSTVATIKKVKTANNDLQTFQGSVSMLDYMTAKPMTLNAIIHVKDCPAKDRKAVLIKVSPQPFTHTVWSAFDKIEKSISCN